jgi:hypothetical protein
VFLRLGSSKVREPVVDNSVRPQCNSCNLLPFVSLAILLHRLVLDKKDINLNSTTLRFASTNEVATVSNGSIATFRIINCQRSVSAVVAVNCTFHAQVIEGDRVEEFQAAVQNYIDEHPRSWDSLVFFRFESFDADYEKVICRLAIRHRNTWQDGGRILRDRGDLLRFLHKLGEQLGINFDSPPTRRLVYEAGTLKDGHVSEFKKYVVIMLYRSCVSFCCLFASGPA